MSKVVIFERIEEARRRIPSGEKRLVQIGARKICLIHTAHGFQAVDDACPHLGHSLSKGTLNPFGEIVCPWHAYRFSIKTGEEAVSRCADLRVYPMEENGSLCVFLPDVDR